MKFAYSFQRTRDTVYWNSKNSSVLYIQRRFAIILVARPPKGKNAYINLWVFIGYVVMVNQGLVDFLRVCAET